VLLTQGVMDLIRAGFMLPESLGVLARLAKDARGEIKGSLLCRILFGIGHSLSLKNSEELPKEIRTSLRGQLDQLADQLDKLRTLSPFDALKATQGMMRLIEAGLMPPESLIFLIKIATEGRNILCTGGLHGVVTVLSLFSGYLYVDHLRANHPLRVHHPYVKTLVERLLEMPALSEQTPLMCWITRLAQQEHGGQLSPIDREALCKMLDLMGPKGIGYQSGSGGSALTLAIEKQCPPEVVLRILAADPKQNVERAVQLAQETENYEILAMIQLLTGRPVDCRDPEFIKAVTNPISLGLVANSPWKNLPVRDIAAVYSEFPYASPLWLSLVLKRKDLLVWLIEQGRKVLEAQQGVLVFGNGDKNVLLKGWESRKQWPPEELFDPISQAFGREFLSSLRLRLSAYLAELPTRDRAQNITDRHSSENSRCAIAVIEDGANVSKNLACVLLVQFGKDPDLMAATQKKFSPSSLEGIMLQVNQYNTQTAFERAVDVGEHTSQVTL